MSGVFCIARMLYFLNGYHVSSSMLFSNMVVGFCAGLLFLFLGCRTLWIKTLAELSERMFMYANQLLVEGLHLISCNCK